MHDVNGKPLKVGDEVIIHGIITECQPSDDYCNCTVETKHGRRPDGSKERFCAINTGVLEKVD